MTRRETQLVTELPQLAPRAADSHKGDFGRVLIAAGSIFMPGAAALAAAAAYRGGAGLVTICVERECIPAIAPLVPEATFTDWTAIGARRVSGEAPACDVLLVGPGLGTEDRGRLVFELIAAAPGPHILDADALNLIARDRPALERRDDRIWTPHPGEFARLCGEKPHGDAERLAAARRFVEERGGVLVLKGHHTVVCDAERCAVNQSGNPGMATAGAGDVLAGLIAALCGQGLGPWEAARLGVHLHGLAGDFAAQHLGQRSLTAKDILHCLAIELKTHAGETSPGGG